ncbi:hypothetical protein DyAD56_23550 [Dyella sp. AD56]|nr:hypothetical protein DyAD56_23550 [Dyella sp. AD56]
MHRGYRRNGLCARYAFFELADGPGRQVGANVTSTVCRQVLQQQSGAATNFKHMSRLQLSDTHQCGIEPLAHGVVRDRKTCVTAVPSNNVEVCRRRADVLVGLLVKDIGPLSDLRIGRGRIAGRRQSGNNVSHNARLIPAIIHHRHKRIAYLVGITQACVNLPQFDAVPTDLDLIVVAPKVFQHAIHAPTYQVAGSIHPASVLGKRIGEETLCGQLRLVQVAARHSGAAQP